MKEKGGLVYVVEGRVRCGTSKLLEESYRCMIHYGIGSRACFTTGFYGNPRVEDRRDLWQLLSRLGHWRCLSWLCGDDFNEILFAHKKRGLRDRSDA